MGLKQNAVPAVFGDISDEESVSCVDAYKTDHLKQGIDPYQQKSAEIIFCTRIQGTGAECICIFAEEWKHYCIFVW